MSDHIKVGIIGAGGNTKHKHIPKLQAIPGVSIETVCNRSPESSQAVADEFGIPRITHTWEDVVNDPRLDAIVIGTWPYMHAPMSIAALNAGKHVLCEARMAMNAHEANDMLKASQAHAECICQIVPSPANLKWHRFIKRNLDEGLIGDLIAVDAFSAGAFVDPDREMNWRDDIHLSGLNTMGLGILYEALARCVGHAATVRANARIYVKERSGQKLHVPDHVDAFGDLENGAIYHIRCSQITGACPTPNDVIFYGSTGTLRLGGEVQKLTLYRPGEPTQELKPPEAEQEFWRVEEEFIGAIRGKEKIRYTSFAEGVRYMEFTQKVANELKIAPSEFRNPEV